MHLGVMSERLEMSHALRRIGHGFEVHYPAVLKLNVDAESVRNKPHENFRLHLTHDVRVYFAEAFVPDYAEQRFFLFKLAQLREERHGRHLLRQLYSVA